ncbi:protein phosphatase [Geopyxis carbonaria]|nr:protein phosphatase [Geopyxis carbonaria]
MDLIKVAKVENVSVLHHGRSDIGTLHLTAHHLIFRRDPAEDGQHAKQPPKEIWVAYPVIGTVYRYPPTASAPAHIRLRNRDFSFVQFRFESDRECREVFDSIKALTVVKGGIEKLYAFDYGVKPGEKKGGGWNLYDPLKEFSRMGVGTDRCKSWRISNINKDYSFSPTYPALLAVPTSISDTTLTHAKNYRSRARIPALTYLHPLNNCTIARCAQPLTGVRGNRSIQDEKLVAAIFASSQPVGSPHTPAYLRNSTPSPSSSSTDLQSMECSTSSTSSPADAEGSVSRVYGAQQRNLIVDARPVVNAYAMQVLGMGSEDMDNYKHTSSPPCTKVYLGIDNIHVMRDSLNKVIEAIKDSDITPLPPSRELLAKSGWLKHIGLLLEGTSIIVRQIALEHAHVLLHCSDGWDRTSQLSSLAQICLDPYFRTMKGFMVLVEKDWVSFGHRFRTRSGFLGHEKWFIEKSTYGQATLERDDSMGDEEAALGEALVGQARNFFTSVSSSNGRSASPVGDGDEGIDDRRTKLARAAEAPIATKPKEVSPMFQQFLDATFQLMTQYPTRFEYNERFLRRLFYHVYSCQYGTFLHDNDKERADARIREKTRSVWDYFIPRRRMWMNERYDPAADGREFERELEGGRVIFPKIGPGVVTWWEPFWGREPGDMNAKDLAVVVEKEKDREMLGPYVPPTVAVEQMSLPNDVVPLTISSGSGHIAPGPVVDNGPSVVNSSTSVVVDMVEGVKELALGKPPEKEKEGPEMDPLGAGVEMM